MSPEVDLAVIICVSFYVPIVVGLRIYFNLRNKTPRRVWSTPSIIHESLFLIATLTGAIGLLAEMWIHIRYINLKKLPEEKRYSARKDLNVISFKMAYYEMPIWAVVMWSVKYAFMCLYWDMARYMPKYIRYTVYFTLGVLGVTFIGVLVMFTMWCRPVYLNWTLTEDLCTANVSAFCVHVGSSTHLITEFFVLLIPILIFHGVQMHRSKRIGILFIFAIGGVTLCISFISYALRITGRKHTIQIKETGTLVQYVEEIKKRVENGRLASYAEGSCAILMLCLPSFRVLLRKFIDSRSPSDDVPENDGLRLSNILMSYHNGGMSTQDLELEPRGQRNRLQRTESESELTWVSPAVLGTKYVDGTSNLSLSTTGEKHVAMRTSCMEELPTTPTTINLQSTDGLTPRPPTAKTRVR